MKLRVARNRRDKDGQIISTEPIGNTPVWKSRAEKTAEVADIDTIEITGLLIKPKDLFVKIYFRLGAVNSGGVFTPASDFQEIEWTITPGTWWSKYIEGRTVFDFNLIMQWIHDENIVTAAGRDRWNLPDLETELIQD